MTNAVRRPPALLLLVGLVAALLLLLGAGSAAAHPECEEDTKTQLPECEHHEDEGGMEVGEDTTTPASSPVGDAVSTYTWSPNMHPVGFSARNVPFSGTGSSLYNSDLAFWGAYAYQGTYAGFRILDISNPADPIQLLNYTGCAGGQGDVLVWQNLLIRSWDAPAASSATCAGALVGTGFEGLHIFDVSNPAAPVLLKAIRMASNTVPVGCGSHTATLVPDLDRGNLYVYNSASSTSCTGIDIVRVPIANPTDAVFLRRAPALRACHDTSVILGGVNLAVCAGGNGFSTFGFDPSIPADDPGGIANPTRMYSRPITGVSIGHSASFTYDGKVLVYGHEPGGGGQAQCQATSSTVNRTIFFFDPQTGDQVGSFLHPRPQTSTENCTWHNFNVVPTMKGYVFVSGNYQAGISVVDFTDPANARQIAFADPAPLSTSSLIVGGDWSTYWYDGHIYESDIRRGLIVWKLDDVLTNAAKREAFSNPQTQLTSFPLDVDPPTVQIARPLDGGSYGLGELVTAQYVCADAVSGVASCVGTVPNGALVDTSSVGTKSFSVTARDVAGHETTVTVTYEVVWNQYAGFFSPISNTAVNVVRAGSAVPVKFTLGGSYGLGIIAAGYPRVVPAPCESGAAEGAVTQTSTAGQSSLQFGDGQYTYVWKTDAAWAGTCATLELKLLDNTVKKASFRFR